MNKPRSYLVNGLLACAVLYFAQSLSRGDRHVIDWVVLGLVGLAALWNLFRLGQRLYRKGGGRDLWHLVRTLLFWIIGGLDTALARPEDVGSWKCYAGWAVLLVAAVDTVALYRKERLAMGRPIGGTPE